MDRKRILITGMSGLIGGIVRQRLQGKHDLSALNRRDVEGVECHRADIADLDAIRPAGRYCQMLWMARERIR